MAEHDASVDPGAAAVRPAVPCTSSMRETRARVVATVTVVDPSDSTHLDVASVLHHSTMSARPVER